MNFNNRLKELSKKNLQYFYHQLSQYGNADDILHQLNETNIIFSDKKYEILANEQFIVLISIGALKKTHDMQIFRIADIDSCYHSKGDFSDGIVGLILENSQYFELKINNFVSSVLIYNHLNSLIAKNTISESKQTKKRIEGRGAYYTFNSDELIIEKSKAFSSKFYISQRIAPIKNIIWCNQYHGEIESTDFSFLKLYLTDGSTIELETTSIINAFSLYLEIKKFVPHLLYGPNEEYEMIFQKSPEQLMALSISQTNK